MVEAKCKSVIEYYIYTKWRDTKVTGRWVLNNKKDLCLQESSKARKEKQQFANNNITQIKFVLSEPGQI